ncbi:MAG: aryl-sulfate sulfotransferase [Cytophagales bacterium]|nr:aryl-sulfate sulfotransferase [Cytophagales bacterium]
MIRPFSHSTSLQLFSRVISVFIIVLLLQACDSGPKSFEELIEGKVSAQVNPFKRVPLGGKFDFKTTQPVKVKVEVKGKNPIKKSYSSFSTRHSIPVLGLYAGTSNEVVLELTTQEDQTFSKSFTLGTDPLPEFFPTVEIDQIDRSKMEPGMHLIEMLIANNGKFQSYTIIFDDAGDIRWFMDMSSTGQITYSALRNSLGNWLYLDWIDLYELDNLGREVKKEQLFNFAGNHYLEELPNGNVVMGGSRKDAAVRRSDGRQVVTRFDHVVEWNRRENRPGKHWDLAEVLDIDRAVFQEDYSLDFAADWFHLNSIAMTEDGSIIASGRNQGIVKVDTDNNPQWILAPHVAWGKAGRAGNGRETKNFLLTALDKNGQPLPASVQQGSQPADDFEWSTGQHSLNWLGDGRLLIFDNGLARNLSNNPTYSRAVEYQIDEENRTIQQVWQYGKERGLDMYSPITSDVDILPRTGNRLIIAGNIRVKQDTPHSKLIELKGDEVVFECRVLFKDAKGTGEKSWAQFDLVFKGERYSLYGN